jgi:geranylgeranyl diphosphate synthase, type I
VHPVTERSLASLTRMQQVEGQLTEFLESRRERLKSIDPETVTLVDEATVAVSGGKRLRAQFCLAGWQATGGDPEDVRAVRAAAAFELLQASALVHDDLMDASDTRRGRAAAHRAFEQRHESAGWSGDRARYGAGAAVLLGDLLLAWAHELLRDSGFDPDTVHRATPLFDLCITEVTAGQYLDLVSQVSGSTDEELALRVVRFKAASYTVVRPLHVGAALGGADPTLLAALAAYGEPVGVAFQLRDDVLGVFGDPEQTGKPAGDDLREGKRTLLLARTAARTDADGRAMLDRCVGNSGLDGVDLRRLRDLIVSSGALASVEQTIADLDAQARAALDGVDATATGEVRPVLETLASAALERVR